MTVPAADPPLTFRDATRADVPQLLTLIQSAYRGEPSRSGWTTEADFLEGQRTDPEGVAAVIDGPDSRLVMVHQGDELVACFQLEDRGEHAYFGLFAVQPSQQGSGLGRFVLREAERIAREDWQAEAMHMTVISIREELIAWYERRGYHRTGEMSPFPYGNERFGIPRRDDLQFELLVKPLS